ncbi:MAG: CHAP domain-containing protein, partial [Ruminococcus flavefaciens]|nr:CHAP domain-containing protein [Ruminococcus flavefaciens]
MTRDGAVEVNAATGKKKRISKRARDAALKKTPEQQAAQDAQAAQPIPGGTAPEQSPNAPPLPHAPGTEPEQD